MKPEFAITYQPTTKNLNGFLTSEAVERETAITSESAKQKIIDEQNRTIRAQYIALNDARDSIADSLEELINGKEFEALYKLRDYMARVGL